VERAVNGGEGKEGQEGKKLITACARKQCYIIWPVWIENREYS